MKAKRDQYLRTERVRFELAYPFPSTHFPIASRYILTPACGIRIVASGSAAALPRKCGATGEGSCHEHQARGFRRRSHGQPALDVARQRYPRTPWSKADVVHGERE